MMGEQIFYDRQHHPVTDFSKKNQVKSNFIFSENIIICFGHINVVKAYIIK